MKAIMVMYDSLNRRMLEPYGCDWVHTPNFKRLAENSVTFTNSYVGSMPCMPARRELHTGRYNFLHRSWGPMEPFDDSMPQILKENGVYTHLVSDHYHYWEDGGCTYHTRYSSWEISRGQEGDPWKGVAGGVDTPDNVTGRNDKFYKQDWINRGYMDTPGKHSQWKTFEMGLEFMRTNAGQDNWFLHIETFDPHEPYFTHERYKAPYKHDYKGRHFDWPSYGPVKETPDEVEHCRLESAALHSMCDDSLGRVLDLMDELDLWKDTMLIVNTDHGFLMAEHDWWGKCCMPFYNEIANTPLFIWDPRSGAKGEWRNSLVQTIDLPVTLVEYFGVDRPASMQGRVLRETIASDKPVREAALFGIHGGHVNVTDGRHVYMRAPAGENNAPLYEYTHIPTHMRDFFSVDELQNIQLAEPFSFTKGCRTMKIEARKTGGRAHEFGNLLFDVTEDPAQEHPLENQEVESQMIEHLVQLMKDNDAPPEQFERLGLD